MPDEDSRAGYAAKLYSDLKLTGHRMEYEVLARIELQSRVSHSAFVDSPKDVLVGSPLFVAQV